MGSTQYDNIVSTYNNLYDNLDNLPCGRLEEANLHAALDGHIKGKRVFELGCGSGHYSRRMLEWGAESVVGVDISAAMIEEARSRAQTADIENGRLIYYVGDASQALDNNINNATFDLVVGAWLLNYAESKGAMEDMWKTIAKHLSKGGIFVGLTIPPQLGSSEELDRQHQEDWAEHGTRGYVICEVEDGFKVHTILGLPGGADTAEFDNYYLRPYAFELSTKAAGFEQLSWLPVVLPDTLKSEFPDGYWDKLIRNPHFKICVARH